LGKILFLGQLKDSWAELRQVTWPTWGQSYQLTFAVLIFAIVFGAAIAGVDYVMDKAFRHILLK
jgi:preprotein translocase SecE subunit